MITYLIGDALFFFLLFLSTKFDPFPLVNRPVNESGGDGEDNGQAFCRDSWLIWPVKQRLPYDQNQGPHLFLI